jgi:hypothetical protein
MLRDEDYELRGEAARALDELVRRDPEQTIDASLRDLGQTPEPVPRMDLYQLALGMALSTAAEPGRLAVQRRRQILAAATAVVLGDGIRYCEPAKAADLYTRALSRRLPWQWRAVRRTRRLLRRSR